MNNFYNINGCILDDTQIKAIEVNSKNSLVVAGAGSGKTLTILGKIKYLIEVKNIKPEDILCISFTNESAKSLKEKLLKINYDIEVLTFHKLGLKILNNDNISIINDNYLDYIIDEYFKSYIKYNKKNKRIFKNILYTERNIDSLFETYEYQKIKMIISTFIKLAKSNNLDKYDIYRFYKSAWFNEKIVIKYILDIYIIYQHDLESQGKIDFDDMIIKSQQEICSKHLSYKQIIIDEFQDTSKVRLDLIKEIIKYTNASLFVVGDDFQSIYRFSGCNLDIFINFKKYFTDTTYIYLKYTYRNSNQLIKVSTNFIMKNPKQLKKQIVSNKNQLRPIKIVFNKSLDYIINKINDEDILILGRNNKDIQQINYPNKLTIHRSKGLEASYVILVNSDNIPSTIRNERILRFVLKEHDYIPYEEERRLFYVALTRTKNDIYIMVNKKISPFVNELIHDYPDDIEIIK